MDWEKRQKTAYNTDVKHLDLFSGIGGFAYAVDRVWGEDSEHIFCDSDQFCRKVIKKHWPESEIYGDIRQLITDTKNLGKSGLGLQWQPDEEATEPTGGRRRIPTPNADRPRLEKARPEQQAAGNRRKGIDLLTGGFPCQPFSAAGVRRGTNDERYLWPAMLEVIQLTKPSYVIAENVSGILTWNEGLVFETVCSDLEAAGYEVQPFIIPAAAVGAPHRRDRVWFVGKLVDPNRSRRKRHDDAKEADSGRPKTQSRPADQDDPEAHDTRLEGQQRYEAKGQSRQRRREWGDERPDWEEDWPTVAARLCSVGHGLPGQMGGTTLTPAKHRKEQIKAYGNAIVPEVAMEIMKSLVL